jgi:hypothetical protein
MTSSPINLHTHGAHISPRGNADNVMLHIPPGMSNTYTYDLPRNMPQGCSGITVIFMGSLRRTSTQVSSVCLPSVRTDGNLPLVTEKSIPIRNMALQYNFVFDRAGGPGATQQSSWPQWVSSITRRRPASSRTAPTVHRSRRSTSTDRSGNEVLHGSGYAGRFQSAIRAAVPVHPSNLQRFTSADGKADRCTPEIHPPGLPTDVQFTVNGHFQPVIKSKAGQTRESGCSRM